ncbi:MAG TPA: discoidin domain-containing protein [Kiritimatiellia bacterium]|nr:discoidin domain-containing protein [Kiritimatiellia bacterium]HRZ11046.1 discoidin domain-containing protein [Kiritimatiellia bacterium]HSA18619.1 discoidin domain-containing protein [Kiritimatiellia bacterium]
MRRSCQAGGITCALLAAGWLATAWSGEVPRVEVGGATVSEETPAVRIVRKIARPAAVGRPVDVVVSSGESPQTNGWDVADGDLETAWAGRAGENGWWLALVYEPPLKMTDIELLLAPSSTTNVMILGSADALDWIELPAAPESGLDRIRYLWIVFEPDASGRRPVVLEVKPIP